MRAISGIDWASDWHDVHIADEHGALLAAEKFSHDELGVSALIELLLSHRVECCAIERPDGLLVGRLLAAGITVLAIHPNQVKAARDRFRAAAGKNDRFDAFVLCELARTDRHRFPVLAPPSDETLALKALVRTREDLVNARVALANQLRAQLQAFWPGAERIFADIDSQIGLAFLERYPTPPTPATSARSAWKTSSRATPTAADAPPPNCSPDCAAHPPPPSSENSSRTHDALL